MKAAVGGTTQILGLGVLNYPMDVISVCDGGHIALRCIGRHGMDSGSKDVKWTSSPSS